MTYEQVLDILPTTTNKPEESHIDPNLEYAAITTDEFLIYSKEKGTWYCLVTGAVVPGRISDVIDANGNMHLKVTGKPITYGKWATAESIDDFFDLFNSGEWREWLSQQY